MWAPFIGFQEIYEALTRDAKSNTLRLAAVKAVIKQGMIREA